MAERSVWPRCGRICLFSVGPGRQKAPTEPAIPSCSLASGFLVVGKNLLDGRYAEFGYTVDNEDLLADVKEGDIIKSAKIISGKENWKESA